MTSSAIPPRCTQSPTRLLCLTALLLAIASSGCAVVSRGIPVPQDLVTTTTIPGFENIRYTIGVNEHGLAEEFLGAIKLGRIKSADVNLLAISGGGADGAFGAGLLSGWTDQGSRPQFQVVTGVSTGALTAPFAFLGSAYDDQLREAYTTLHNDDIFHLRNIFGILWGDSLALTGPLYNTVSAFIDEAVLKAIAAEHNKGRRLFVMTTNLDAQRRVIWNMGAIANSGRDDALRLFRKIIIASTSIPVAFPPQYIEVEADGSAYTEMHVDGGVMGQVFLHLPKAVNSSGSVQEKPIKVYVIRNAKVVGSYSAMTPLIIPIMLRTLKSLTTTQGIGNLYEIYQQTKEAGAEFRLAYVPDNFKTDHHDMFEPTAMKAMFDRAYEMAVTGYPWQRRPPEEF